MITFFFLALIIVIAIYSITSVSSQGEGAQTHVEELPHISDYRKQHPDLFDGKGIKCANCGSRSIRAWGLRSREDEQAIHTCNHCGTKLYRTGAWTKDEKIAALDGQKNCNKCNTTYSRDATYCNNCDIDLY
ncbi:hypothetical protein Spea_1147 [Shewanella pealeana ATCC 700345]|uniref:Uncharacterized protein n=1 Tax=Shewanella pealeana (strain ATCC 700345 / ANG-SQ1) TaxID=398579 RepID=A8H1N7_SHEPA|nr:hypothetical protein Spea_1147 [Shewanella pealeana ATCC 700345]